MNAFLVRHQIDFSKMHNNDRFLERISTVDATLAATLSPSDALTPYGVEARYPSDAPELLPGEEVESVQIARHVRSQILDSLSSYLSAN